MPTGSHLLGDSPAMKRVNALIERVGASDASVMIHGETGTGKELVARAIHSASSRRDGPFIAINCAAVPPTLLESELFGHARGAFTDAKQARQGLFLDASGGYAFQGVAGATVDRKVGPTTTVRVDTDGSQAFGWTDTGSGTQSTVFDLLDKISAGLRAGDDVTGTLNDIDAVMQNMLTAASSNGSRQKVLESTMSDVSSQQLTIKGQLSDVEDIDMAAVLMNMQLQEVTYQGALAAGAHVLQPSLLDFLQ